MKPELYNGLSLAYIGDTVYETYVREMILDGGLTKVNDLHKKAIKYTSGVGQAYIVTKLLEDNILTEDEQVYYKRGRNSHVKKVRKNVARQTYLRATGYEALIGYLYLSKNFERLDFLFKLSSKILDERTD